MPKVSVIIPVYNCEKYIREAVESVLAQTYKDFELIVVDDGSTDDSGRIVREEFGQVARYYYQPNGGAAKARNAGVKESRGQYIAFLDADDIWAPEKLAVQVPILDGKAEIGLVHSNLEWIDSFGKHVKIWETSQCNDGYARQFLKGHVISPDTSLIRREIFVTAGGFDEDFRAAGYEDLEFFIRLGQLCEIYWVEEPLAKARDWESKRHNEATALRNRGVFLQRMIKRFGNHSAHTRFLSREQARYCSDIGRFLVKTTKLLEGRRELMKSIALGLRAFDPQIAFRSLLRFLKSFI